MHRWADIGSTTTTTIDQTARVGGALWASSVWAYATHAERGSGLGQTRKSSSLRTRSFTSITTTCSLTQVAAKTQFRHTSTTFLSTERVVIK
eukprot:1049104-Pyramimonas_sp.AAC.1